MASFNIDGISDDKLEALLAYLNTNNVDIMNLQETKVAEFPERFYHRGYHIIHNPPLLANSSLSKSGGCATLVKNCWKSKQLETLPTEGDVCWTEVDFGHEVIATANVYWRSGGTLADFDSVCTDVTDRLESLRCDGRGKRSKGKPRKTVLCGDVNTDPMRPADLRRSDLLSRRLADTSLHRIDLDGDLGNEATHVPYQDNGSASYHIDALAIDLRLVPLVTAADIDTDLHTPIAWPFSDHRPLWCSVKMRTTPMPRSKPAVVFKFKKATKEQWKKARRLLSAFVADFLPRAKRRVAATSSNPKSRQRVVNALNKEMNAGLHRAYEKSIGTHKVRLNGSPHWNPVLAGLKSKISAHEKQAFLACKRGEVNSAATAKKSLKKCRRELKYAIRKADKAKNEAATRNAESGNLTQAWKVVSNLGAGSDRSLGDHCTYKGVAHDGQNAVGAALTQKMKDTHTYQPQSAWFDQGPGTHHDEVRDAMPELLAEEHDLPCNADFVPGDLERILQKLRSRETKQPGPDGVKYWMLTRAGADFQEALLWFYNLVWGWECIPTEWKHAHIRYLYKGGRKSKFDLERYRPISLISCVGKAYTMLWLPRLEKILRVHISPAQGGFSPKAGAVEALWTITTVIDAQCSERRGSKHAYACFADTATAFDTVWRDGLYFILYSYGVRGKMLRMIKMWHEGATAIGQWYTANSRKVNFSQGVRQGCVIAPLLYVCFVNPVLGVTPPTDGHSRPDLLATAFEGGLSEEDGLRVLEHSARLAISAQLYVDDVCLLSPGAESLQRNMDRYVEYARKWRYKLHVDKFHIVPFGVGQLGETFTIVDAEKGTISLAAEAEATILGVDLEKTRTGAAHLRQAAAAATKHAPLLSRTAHATSTIVALAVQRAKVEPCALYGSHALGLTDKALESLDGSVTAKCMHRSHLLPRNARSEMALYEAPHLKASDRVKLDEARLLLKLRDDPHPWRRALMEHAAGPEASVKLTRQFKRANDLLSDVGLTCRVGGRKVGKHRKRVLLMEKKAGLMCKHQTSLQNDLPLLPKTQGLGRGSASIWNDCVEPCGYPLAFREAHRLQSIKHDGIRRLLQRIRAGLVDCAAERAKRGRTANLTCGCGAAVEDARHVVLECPLNLARRSAILDHIRVASDSDPLLKRLTQRQSDSSILLASLGAMLPGTYLAADAPFYGALMGLAAPKWVQQFEHLLN